MITKQYTIRNIPEPVNRYLRKKSKLSGKSLNQVIIEELSTNVVPTSSTSNSLSWFIGSGIDDATLSALEEDDKQQKEKVAKEQ